MALNSFDIRFSRRDENSEVLARLMTGQLISQLEISLEFEEKAEFLDLRPADGVI